MRSEYTTTNHTHNMDAFEQIRKNISTGNYEVSFNKEDFQKTDFHDRQQLVREHQAEFRKDLAKAYDIKDHPKEEILFNLAWSYGQSNGYYEVLHHYDELVKLIR